ncbi:MAG: MCE family protein [Candidatus Omnitrophica bacterium]|nr:MCE family protein [Candidatus Omnitrophota bacterium]
MKFSKEIKAGIVVVVAVAGCVVFYAKTTNIRTRTYELKTSFTYAGNLKDNAIVKLSGINVGRLKQTSFVYDPKTKVECILELDDKAKIRKDSIAYIGSSGLVGDVHIGITGGESKEFLKNHDVVDSEDPVETRLLMKKADSIASNLDKILLEVKNIITDNEQGINDIVKNIESTTENFKEFSEDLKKHPWKLLFKGD